MQYKIKNGLTINLKGAAQNIIIKAAAPKTISITVIQTNISINLVKISVIFCYKV